MPAIKRLCSASVHDSGSRSVGFHPCDYIAKVKRDGKWYCGVHDPLFVERKERERTVKYDIAYKKMVAALDREERIVTSHPLAVDLARAVLASNQNVEVEYLKKKARAFLKAAGEEA